MFLSIRYHLQQFFSSGWSRWVDMEYIVKYHSTRKCYCLVLLQMKVNSKTGKRKYNFTDIMSSTDDEFLTDVAKSLRPKLSTKRY
jgi:hypothetical protein